MFQRLLFFTLLTSVILCTALTAQDHYRPDPFDDTACFIHLSPGLQYLFVNEPFSISIAATLTDARVFSIRLIYDHSDYDLVSVTPGSHPDLHVLPHDANADTISIDGFFHPNYTGTTTVAVLQFIKIDAMGDAVTEVGFIEGQGYSGTADVPEPIVIEGDTATVILEGTPPNPSTELIIIPQPQPVFGTVDSVCLYWNPVYYDQDGDTVIHPVYIIEFEDVLNAPSIFDSVGSTFDTFFCHDFIKYYFEPGDTGTVNVGVYQIITRKTQPH